MTTANLVTLKEASEQLGVSVRTIRNWIDCGKLPVYRVGPRILRVKQRDVDKLVTRVKVYQPAGGGVA